MSLIGNLSDVALGDVLRLFAASGKTGLLTASAAGRQTLVRIQQGAVVHATAGRLQGDDAILDLFGWKEGQLVFVPEEKVIEPNVTLGVDVLILEGLRTGEAFHRMHELQRPDVMRILFELTEAGFLETVDAQKTLRAQVQGRFGKETAELDGRLEEEWRLMARFTEGILRVEVRNNARKGRRLPVSFRPGLGRDVSLPRAVFAELGLREGEDVFVRPVA